MMSRRHLVWFPLPPVYECTREWMNAGLCLEWSVKLEKCYMNAVHLPFQTKIEYFWIGICEYTSHWYEFYIQLLFLCPSVRPQEYDRVFNQLSEALCPFRSICQDNYCHVLLYNYILLSSVQISFFQMRYLVNIRVCVCVCVIMLPHTCILTMNQLYTEPRGSDTAAASPLTLNSSAVTFSVARR